MEKISVIDFFCGAGGFSEGFRQQGFEIILGIDKWQPAINTFNFNFNQNFKSKNILDYYDSIEEIDLLPNTEIIIGSPPCVSFSSSNKSGKADKALGLKLTESFLRVIAVKKHQKDSNLQAWYMENVENSKKHLKNKYTFYDLNLKEWAKKNGINPKKIAIKIEGNSSVLNSADYGSFQARKRLITGEIILKKKFIIPKKTHSKDGKNKLEIYKKLDDFRQNFPNPYSYSRNNDVIDPTYGIRIKAEFLTDQFYDTGVYKCDWETSKFRKINHPYMGKMSFPENPLKPSRTITATKISNSRESIIYKSELARIGDGEFRSPTVREAACLMGFPISYQFLGSENTKWKLVGNAVCPSVSRALAKDLRWYLNLENIQNIISTSINIDQTQNLNNFTLKTFDNPPKKNKGARFRRHTFKTDNITVALSNYDIKVNEKNVGKWRSTILYGTGEGFGIDEVKEGNYKSLEPIIINNFSDGKQFIEIINNGFSEKIADKYTLQKMYENKSSIQEFYDPVRLIDEVKSIIGKFDSNNEMFVQSNSKIFKKDKVSKKQLFALYAINKIVTTTNSKETCLSIS
ncbi:DNA (cytosine-5-)-methyltransferase [Flavobacterium tructae]|uniref:DNA cytosine methyltransferase n=1 Tax=Flavobacterium tructae TaxID=1114873 RepID=UPI000B5BB801|nr:DNA (cytosine-5-)-methyltransferase [Flavobacterium tructae]OXB17377.1 DNA (cytosine-5-)-methyltransferase [Flavobacterium tructae]